MRLTKHSPLLHDQAVEELSAHAHARYLHNITCTDPNTLWRHTCLSIVFIMHINWDSKNYKTIIEFYPGFNPRILSFDSTLSIIIFLVHNCNVLKRLKNDKTINSKLSLDAKNTSFNEVMRSTLALVKGIFIQNYIVIPLLNSVFISLPTNNSTIIVYLKL